MYKLFFILFVSYLTACNSSADTNADKKNDSANQQTSKLRNSYTEAEMNFIDACVESSKASLGEAKAYTFCKCMLPQAKAKVPDMDSTAMDALGRDTAEVTRMAANCK